MKILHVASFVGNIGDNASHRGLQRLLGELLPQSPEVTRLEIRKFYKNYRHDDACRFDAGFVDLANRFDLLVVGGGGFLDYWVPGSASGTTFDIAPELLARLRVPTWITSVGCAPHQAVPDGNVGKFQRFLDAALANPRVRIAVRNDGSVESLRRDIGAQYLAHIPEVVDHGFYYDATARPDMLPEGDFVALNIADDQIGMNSSVRGAIDRDRLFGELAEVCSHVIARLGLPLVLVPHIHGDLRAIAQLLARLDDYLVRDRVAVAPCIQGDEAADRQFGIYKHSRLVLGTRLHANVCSLAMNRPTLGLVALDRVKYLYDHLGLQERCVLLDGSFAEDLNRRIDQALREPAAPGPLAELDRRRDDSRARYRRWLADAGWA